MSFACWAFSMRPPVVIAQAQPRKRVPYRMGRERRDSTPLCSPFIDGGGDLVVITAVTAAAVLAPVLAPADPAYQFFEGLTLQGAPLTPNEQFLLGTDLLGRDLFSRMLYGARTSLIIGVAANGVRWLWPLRG